MYRSTLVWLDSLGSLLGDNREFKMHFDRYIPAIFSIWHSLIPQNYHLAEYISLEEWWLDTRATTEQRKYCVRRTRTRKQLLRCGHLTQAFPGLPCAIFHNTQTKHCVKPNKPLMSRKIRTWGMQTVSPLLYI